MSQKVLEEWKNHDPLLTDPEGFQRFLTRAQCLQELQSQLTTWKKDGWGPNEIKKYRGIWAEFATRDDEDPRRFNGLLSIPVIDLTRFEEVKKKLEAEGDVFLCFQVMHEETLDHDPERPHIKGTFSKYDYCDYNWESTSKPPFMREIKKHLNRVSRWYNRGQRENEPYPTPPLWKGELP